MAVRYSAERKSWVCEFEQSGERVFKRFPKGIARSQAEAWETRKRREIFDRVALDKRPDATLREAFDLWLADNRRKNQKQAQSEARQWDEWIGARLLREAPEVALEAVRTWRAPRDASKGRPKKPATINALLACLKAVLAHAEDVGLCAGLSKRIKLSNPRNAREYYLSKPEVAALAGNMATKEGAAAVWLLAYCGPRISELLAHPKPRDGRLHFPARTTKNSKPRMVPVPKAAQKHLWCLPLAYDYQAFYDEFVPAKKAAGLKHINIHDLRHTCASWLINEGVDLYTVAAILGDTLQQAQRYAHLADQTLAKAMARLK
jgi:integrase